MAYQQGDHFGLRLDGPDRFATLAGDYRQMERELPRAVRNKVFGRVATDAETQERWLQYWYFYLYNDAQFAGRVDMHEGDWEMVQFKLGADDAPVTAVYAQHAYGEARPYDAVERDGDRPVVYAGRGSHASYFEPGLHRTHLRHTDGHYTNLWWDAADGNGPQLAQELLPLTDGWAQWRGAWGGTQKSSVEPIRQLDGESPGGPVTHGQWSHPSHFEQEAIAHDHSERRELPPAPQVTVRRAAPGLELRFDFSAYAGGEPHPDRLLVTITVAGEPPRTETIVVDSLLKGYVLPRAAVAPDHAATVAVSTIDTAGVPTAPLATELPALAPEGPRHVLRSVLDAIDDLFAREAAHDQRPVGG
jgi:hypothetical protein